jgi:hypothetical protein
LTLISEKLHHIFFWRPNYFESTRAADVTSLLYSICNFDFVVTIVVIVQMYLAFKKSLQERSLDIKAEP